MASAPTLENLTLNLTQGIHVRGPLDETFAVLLEQIGPKNEILTSRPLLTLRPCPSRPNRGREKGGIVTWAMARPFLGTCAGHQAANVA